MTPVAHPWALSRSEWIRANAVAYGFAVAACAVVAVVGGVLVAVGAAEFASGVSVLMILVVPTVIVVAAIGALFNSIALGLPLTALASRVAARTTGPRPAALLFASAGAVVGVLGTLWPITLLILFSNSINSTYGSSSSEVGLQWGWVATLPNLVMVAAAHLAAWVITVRPRTRIARLESRDTQLSAVAG